MTWLKLWGTVALLGFGLANEAFAQKAGDEVVVVSETAELKHERTVVATTSRGNHHTVRQINGKWLWVDIDGTRGWLGREHVIPASQAVDYFTNALRNNSNDVDALIARAIAWSGRKEYAKAIKDCSDAIAISPKRSCAYKIRGNIRVYQKQYYMAITDYDTGIRLRPSDGELYYNRGTCHLRMQSYDNALADLTEAIRKLPKYAKCFASRGETYSELKDFQKAMADYTVAVELDPNSATSANDLAWLLATCPDATFRNGERAVRLATSALTLPHDVDLKHFVRDTLAAAYAENGQFEQAVQTQEMAIAGAASEYRDEYEARLNRYHAGLPFREPAAGGDSLSDPFNLPPIAGARRTGPTTVLIDEEQTAAVVLRLTSERNSTIAPPIDQPPAPESEVVHESPEKQ